MGFDPISMAVIATTVGGGLSAASQWQAGNAAEAAGEYNAREGETQARFREGQTRADVGRVRRDFEKFRGSLRGDLAAFGASSSEGTGLLMAQEAARQAKLDELNVITQGANEARALRAGARIDRYEGQAVKSQKRLGAFATAMSTFGATQQMRQG